MKRIVSFLLAILIMMSLLPVNTMAAELPESLEAKRVNPVYSNILKPEDLKKSNNLYNAPLYAATTYFSDPTEVGELLRAYWIKRTEGFATFGYVVPSSQWTQDGIDEIVNDILDVAFAHTGVPNEGDYIRWNTCGWKWSASVDRVSDGGWYYYAEIGISPYWASTAAQENTVDSRVDSLLTQLNPTGSDYQKLKTVYDWICANVTYDYANLNDNTYLRKHSAYAALVDRTAVCQGYTMLLYRLALEMGIDSRAIPSIDSENHIWNILKVGNYYYNTDATWDAPIYPGEYQWFLRGSSDFPRHTRDAEYTYSSFTSKYPTSTTKYNPGSGDTGTTPSTPLKITKQPQDVTAASGEMVYVTVEATGDGLQYQWYYKDTGMSGFAASVDTDSVYDIAVSQYCDGRQLYCKITDKYGNSVTSNIATIRMSSGSSTSTLKITKQPQDITAASGENAKFTLEATGEGLTYQWYYKFADSSTYQAAQNYSYPYFYFTMDEDFDGLQVYCKITDKYGNSVTSNTATVRLPSAAKPAITKQPQNVTVAKGETATFTIEATGDGLTYQWWYKDPGMSSAAKASSTSTSYSFQMWDASNGRVVYCVVTDRYGYQICSSHVTATMAQTLTITQQPKSVTVQNGETAKVTIKATGDGLKYQWFVKMPGSSSYSKSSQTGTTYSIAMNDSRNGMKVCCKVTDKYGKSITSEVATLKQAAVLKITQQPKNVTVLSDETVKVTVKATGDGLKYQWFVKMPGSSSYQKGSQTTSTYSIKMNDARSGMKVCCKVTDKYGKSITSEVATLKKAAALVITQQPKSVTVQSGATAKVTVKATGEGLKYQWFVKMPGSSSYVKGSQTGTTYSIAMNASRSGMKVCCKITDKYGRSKTSEVATLKQVTPLAITTQPKSVTVLSDETVKVTVKASGEGLKYQWFVKMPGSSSYAKSSQTGTTYSVKMNDSRSGMKVCCKVTDKYGNSITSGVATLKKAATLAITQQPKSVSVASGATAKVTVKATGEGLKFQWFVKMPGSSSYSKSSQTGTTYSIAMNASRNGMKVCCKVTDKYGRSITSEVATLKQTSTLTITQQPKSVTVPIGEAAKVSIKATGEGLTYQWYVKMPGSSSYSKSSQTGTTYSVQMTAARSGMQVFCKVTDKYGKSVNSSIVTLKKATTLTITQQPKSVTVPIGETAKVTVKAVGDGLSYQWFYRNAGKTDFLTSSQTTATYSVKMTEACAGRQLCCMVTDQYGNILITNTVTLRKG